MSLDQPPSKKEKKEIDTQILNFLLKYFDFIESPTLLRFLCSLLHNFNEHYSKKCENKVELLKKGYKFNEERLSLVKPN